MRRLFLILIVLVLAACGGEDNTPPPASQTPIPPSVTPRPTSTPVVFPEVETEQGKQAQLRVVHASPDLPAVDLYLDGANIGSRFTPGLFHNRPLAFNAGDYTLNVLPTGTDPRNTTPLVDFPITLPEDESTIILLLGTADDLQVEVYQEDLSALPDDTARLSMVNAIPDGPAVVFQEAERVLARDVVFGSHSAPVKLTAGNHTFNFVSGTSNLASLDLPVAEKSVYTVVLLGGENAQAIVFQTLANRETQVRVVHASPDAGPVDIYLDDRPLAAELPYREWTEWQTFRSLPYELRIVPAGEPDAAPLYSAKIALAADKSVDLVLVDEVQRLRLVQIEEDTSITPANQARLLFINAAFGTTGLSVNTPGGPVDGLGKLNFGTASQPVLFNAEQETFSFQTTESQPREVDILAEYEWFAGTTNTIVITGYPNTDPLVLSTEVGTEEEASEDTASPEEYQLRVIHALPDVGSLDIEMNGSPIARSLASGASTDYITLPIDSVELTFRETGAADPLLDETFTPPDAPLVTLFIYGSRDEVLIQIARDTLFEIPINVARLRVFHGAPLQPTLVVGYLEPPLVADDATQEVTEVTIDHPLSEAIPFGVPSEAKDFAPGTYELRFVDNDTQNPVFSMPDTTFEQGVFYDLLILPDSSGLGINPVLIPHFN